MLKELLNDHQLYHSEFQQDYSITTKAGGTLYGQYKQALRELYKRTRGLRESYCDREKLIVEIEEMEYKSRHGNKFEKQYAKIEHRRKVMLMEECDRVIEDTEREFKRFYQQASYLKEQIGELTDEKRNKLDKEMWIFKVKEMAVIDYMTIGRLSPGTYDMINSFPGKDRKILLEEIRGNENINKLVYWYENKEEDHLQIEDKDINVKLCLSEL
jgi:hypothetical protein